ncbi:MAG: lipoprotein-releasing ABC transporter permease subunit [Rickettsiales bacterium]
MNFLRLLKLELQISIKYLQSKNKEKFISINTLFSFFGIMIGVAALLIVMSIMNGFREELSNKIIGLNSDIVVSNPQNQPIKNYGTLIKKLKKTKEVSRVSGVIEKQGLIVKSDKSSGVIVKSAPIKDLLSQTDLGFTSKSLKSFKGNKVLIGIGLANTLKARVGEKISLLAPEFNTTILGRMPKTKDFIISGIYRSGLTEYDETVVFIPFKSAQIYYDMENSVNQIEVFLNNHDKSSLVSLLVRDILDYKYIVRDWKQLNFSLFNALKTERVAMFTILSLIIIVAAFNIISSLTMLVMDKSKEIAVLKTIGMMKGSIIRIFLLCGLFISLVATIVGLILGYFISDNIQSIKDALSKVVGTNLFDPVVYYLDSLPSKTEMSDIKSIVVIVVIATIFSTLYPAWKAGKIDPVKILKAK